jgi:uncharacterized protein YcfJ
MRKPVLFALTLAVAGGALAPAAADAQYGRGPYERGPVYAAPAYPGPYGRDGYAYDRGYGYDRARAWRRCRAGDGGTIIGAIAGGLLGSGVAGRGDHALGAVLGAAGGALAGRAIERSDCPGWRR